ncbi:MAG: alpha-amylase family protein [Ilumatobacteraceae bacterium]
MSSPSLMSTRFDRRWPAAERALRAVYGGALDGFRDRIVATLNEFAQARSDELRQLDLRREAEPMWFQHQRMIGYVAYTDRFAGRLDGIAERIDYLSELGVTYLHLMPLLLPRPGDNDGGYAVADYDHVDPTVGSMADLETLAGRLRDRGISLCIDVVMNHTAQEHPWAVAAQAGDAAKHAYYITFPDRTLPDQYEETLREVFPEFAPGNFTLVDGRWVWTTFNEFQWDLDFANPDVFIEMLAVMLRLANRGVEVLRLDAAPFIWKRLGTDCENQPEVHHLLSAYRALTAIVAPSLLLQAEAIVPREQLVAYLGAELEPGDPQRNECNLAYNNQLMVQLWSSLAATDGRLMSNVLASMGQAPHDSAWCTYVRCHDDIGWAITGDDAASVGWDQFAHRDFLNEFYSGDYAMSYAHGAKFQENDETGDARISGTTASLCGIEDALLRDDDAALDAALKRMELLYAVTYAYGGIPLLYMGDEIGLRNDTDWSADPVHADDNRWMHRPHMDWAAADRRSVDGSLEQRVFSIFTRLATARASLPEVRAGGTVDILRQGDDRLFAFARRHRRENPMWMVANFGDRTLVVKPQQLYTHHVLPARCVLSGADADMIDDVITLPPLGWVWLTR